MDKKLLYNLSKSLDIELAGETYEKNFKMLSAHIDYLIQHDFNKLMSVLYRVDVYEQKLKKALADNSEGRLSGEIIARLMIEREAEKVRYRELYKEK